MRRIWIGTAAWADKELIESGLYFPKGVTTPEERLRFYAAEFPLVEVDTSYYAIPLAKTVQQWVERTPPDFVFDIKAFRLFTTHPTEPKVLSRGLRETLPAAITSKPRFYYQELPDELKTAAWNEYLAAVQVLQRAGKLGVILCQFPPWFMRDAASHRLIEEVRDRLRDYDVAVEFRNRYWLDESVRARTLAFLRSLKLSLVGVDEPQGFESSVPPLAEVTGSYGIVRFHGRNAATWEKKGLASANARFDYLYRPSELLEWKSKIFQMAEEAEKGVHLVINTNHMDQGPQNARLLNGILDLDQ